MSREESIFTISYMAGIGHYETGYDNTLSESESRENLSSAALRFEEALNSGYVPDEESSLIVT